MVCDIVDCFIAEGWVRITHHCRTPDRLKIKAELLILGTLATLGGTLQSFRQLKPLTHICASDHSNFYLSFVAHVASISHEYVFMPRTMEELLPIMRRYEEEGLPGVARSVDVVHVKRANCPAGDYNCSKVRIPIHHLRLNASQTMIIAFLECLVLSLEVTTISILSR